MRSSATIVALLISGVLLLALPVIHAAVRDANSLYAIAVAQRLDDTDRGTEAVVAYIEGLPGIPSAPHWVAIGAGVACIACGLLRVLGLRRFGLATAPASVDG